MKKNSTIPISLMVIALLLIQLLLTLHTPAQIPVEQEELEIGKARTAKLSDRVRVRAAGQSNYWMGLKDGRELATSYIGKESVVQSIEQNRARALSLASDDFNGDDSPDLVCGYASPSGSGIVVLHRGAEEIGAPFLAPAQAFELPEAAEFLGAGDFDADGCKDLVAASSSGEALYLLRGDGRAGLLSPERIELPGRVTALVVGEVNRADGLADVVVGVDGRDGPKALVFEAPKGALRREPEIISLPAAAASMAIGQLDSSYEYDFAVAVGSELLIVHGRDRQLLTRSNGEREEGDNTVVRDTFSGVRVETGPAEISRRSFGFNIEGIAIGDFAGGSDRHAEIAVMSGDGRIQYAKRAGSGPGDREAGMLRRQDTWQVVNEVRMPPRAPGARPVFANAKVASLTTDDLLITGEKQLSIVSGGPGSKQPLHGVTKLDVDGGVAAVLPIRLSGQALSDLVVLRSGATEPSISLITPQATFGVTNTNDSGVGSLRQAILDANANPGLDAITFNITATSQGFITQAAIPVVSPFTPLPIVSDPVDIGGVGGTIDPVTKKIVATINGVAAGTGANGLTITAGNSVVRGLAIGNFNGHAISLMQGGNNRIANNNLGTDETGAENRGNAGEGVNIRNSNGNMVMGNTITFNGDGGSVINSIENFIRDNNLGTDATMTRNMGNRGTGFGFNSASNNRWEFNRSFFNRFGFVSLGTAGTILQGNKVMNNIDDGFFATSSAGITIGGESRGAFNIFGRNGRHGVNLGAVMGAVIKANFFGTDPQGGEMGNGSSGVNLDGVTSMTQIGGPVPEARNTFTFNRFGITAGVFTKEKLWIFNTYRQNTNLAVDIGRSGPDSNDFRDLDRASGGSLNSPELTSAVATETETIFQGRLNSTPTRSFNIQYYWSPNLGSLGRGQGIPLGAIQVTTDANGDTSVNARLNTPLPGGTVSALTTDLTTGDASEFGNEVPVTGTAAIPDLQVEKSGPETAKCREMVTYTITVRNVGTAAAIGARIIDTLPGCVQEEVEVINPEGTSFSGFPNGVTTVLPRLDPGASVTITIKATLSEECSDTILNLVSGIVDGDEKFSNNQDQVQTRVECTKIVNIRIEGKHVIVGGSSFQRGDQIDINGNVANTKFRDTDELLAKKGKKSLLACDPANPGRMNVIKLLRQGSPGTNPIQDTAAFATCP